MENLVEFTDDNFEAEVLQSDVPVIVDVKTASFCNLQEYRNSELVSRWIKKI